MDFLDPKRRKAHRRRLFIGYVLMSIMVAIGTMIILYLAYGYDIDRKTGTVIQNGIVFVDSEPGGARIFLNEVEQGNRTDARMVLPAGDYTIRLEAEGYRTWERRFNLEGGQIQRLVYPFLLPSTLTSQEIRDYDSLPGFASQSPDRRWVLMQRPGQVAQFDLYDLRDAKKAPSQITLPSSILTSPTTSARLQAIEWSDNNRHLLVKRTSKNINDYLMIDRERPALSLNINTTLGISPVEVSLRDGHHERIYYLDERPGTLRSADIKAKSVSGPLISAVSNYTTYDDNIVLYTTEDSQTAKGKVDYRIFENDKSYKLRSLSKADRYILDVSRFDGEWYYVVGSSTDNVAYVYKNPLPALKDEDSAPLSVAALMRLTNPQFVSFSEADQFIALQSDNQLLVLDLDDDRQYRTTLDHEFSAGYQVKWMDDHRLLYVVNNQTFMLDFDGSNEQLVVKHELAAGPFFDPDFNNVIHLTSSSQYKTKKALWQTALETKN